MISSKQELNRHTDKGLIVVSGELHASGPGELVSKRGVLSVHDVTLMRNAGGGINYSLTIKAFEPRTLHRIGHKRAAAGKARKLHHLGTGPKHFKVVAR